MSSFRFVLLLAAFAAAPAHATSADADPEQQLIAALDQLQSGHLAEARATLERLVQRQPNFQLAQLFHGELVAVLSGKPPAGRALDDVQRRDLMEEARLRLWRDTAPPQSVPDVFLQIPERHAHAVVVDLPRARLYLMENRGGRLSVVRDYYAGMGKNGSRKERKGDNRTPVGVYRVTGWIPDQELPDLYGAGAFPVSYPNTWDQLKRRGGDGIWLHGVPRAQYSRAPRSSEGCVTMANADLEALKPYLQLGETPVVFSDTLRWLPAAEAAAAREEFAGQVEQWRSRWSAVDTDGYLGFYADDFMADGMDRRAFAAHKRRVNAGKSRIDVTLDDLELYRYPGDEPLMLAKFTQVYRSNNLSRTTRKEQFWRQEADGAWRIVREASR